MCAYYIYQFFLLQVSFFFEDFGSYLVHIQLFSVWDYRTSLKCCYAANKYQTLLLIFYVPVIIVYEIEIAYIRTLLLKNQTIILFKT